MGWADEPGRWAGPGQSAEPGRWFDGFYLSVRSICYTWHGAWTKPGVVCFAGNGDVSGAGRGRGLGVTDFYRGSRRVVRGMQKDDSA